jgi:nicotinamidase-related amidase
VLHLVGRPDQWPADPPGLRRSLEELSTVDVKQLVVVGAQTEVCVDTTCRRAFSLGFNVTLVSDAHSTWGNDTLTADQIISHTNQTLAGWFVRTARTAEIAGST